MRPLIKYSSPLYKPLSNLRKPQIVPVVIRFSLRLPLEVDHHPLKRISSEQHDYFQQTLFMLLGWQSPPYHKSEVLEVSSTA